MIKRKDLKGSTPSRVASREARRDRAILAKGPKGQGDPRKSDVLFYGTDRYRLVTPFFPRAPLEIPPSEDPDSD